jgi:rhodanese-related sulfurtransferase
VVTVCNRGHSSAVAAEQLRRQGHEAFFLAGGLEAWKSL